MSNRVENRVESIWLIKVLKPDASTPESLASVRIESAPTTNFAIPSGIKIFLHHIKECTIESESPYVCFPSREINHLHYRRTRTLGKQMFVHRAVGTTELNAKITRYHVTCARDRQLYLPNSLSE